ncbi:MAG TPA: redoxin domain-containing protein [Blastocatellia bacterium]|nr:redoxin domain-containing protein [Blastocatellia bacterium]HMV86960.1 redoxin domain-containing protein [Blastocatellia bacterium]HMX28047.1 redoxin domain-containing protein [Blastocatellia bacterium]HMY72221.1 redoxin domain-containing protein [Blastocatellia bacterium]HMZ17038.1 redoxin domain-containing protein [Blastocatellia bacterium]
MILKKVFRLGLALFFAAAPLFLGIEQSRAKDSAGTKAADFDLKDQFDKSASHRFPKQKVTVLTFGDRKGSEQIEGWVRPLWDRYQTKIDQQGVAVLTSVPFFARGVVRGVLKSKVKHSVLLDWTGKVSKAYGYSGGKANLYVIDREGNIVLKLTGAATPAELQKVFAQIDRLL